MTHHMKLTSSVFAKIAMGSKTIELRPNNDKRQKINVGDTVVFNCNENSDIITAKFYQHLPQPFIDTTPVFSLIIIIHNGYLLFK